MKWFSLYWYKYLFAKPDDPHYTDFWKRLLCRIRGHPYGIIYYNINGIEPNYQCKNCGDEIK